MFRRPFRGVAAVGAAATIALALSACGSGDGAADKSSEKDSTQSGSQGAVEGTVEFFQSKSESVEIVDKLIEEFEKENPGVTVTQTNAPDALAVLKTRLAKNDVPDVIGINVSNLNDISTSGLLSDLEGTEAAGAVENQTAVEYIETLAGTDELVAVPWTVNAQVVLYDKDQFKEMGLEEPETWDEFVGLAKEIKDKGEDAFYFTWKDAWTAKLVANSIGGSLQGPHFWTELQEGKVNFADSDAWHETGEKLLELKALAQDDPFGKGYDDGNAAFASGDTVMYVQGTWAIPEIRATNPDKNIGAFVMPVYPVEGENVILSGPDSVLTVTNEAKDPEAAQAFVDFLMSQEAQEIFANDQSLFSVRRDVPPADDTIKPLKENWLDQNRVATYPDSMFTGASQMEAIIQQFLQDEDIDAMLNALDADYAQNGVR